MIDTQFVFSDIAQGCNIGDHQSHTEIQRNLLTGVSEDGKLLIVDDTQVDSTIESSQFLDTENKDDDTCKQHESFEILYPSTESVLNEDSNQNCNISNNHKISINNNNNKININNDININNKNNICSNSYSLEISTSSPIITSQHNNNEIVHSPSSVSSPQEMFFVNNNNNNNNQSQSQQNESVPLVFQQQSSVIFSNQNSSHSSVTTPTFSPITLQDNSLNNISNEDINNNSNNNNNNNTNTINNNNNMFFNFSEMFLNGIAPLSLNNNNNNNNNNDNSSNNSSNSNSTNISNNNSSNQIINNTFNGYPIFIPTVFRLRVISDNLEFIIFTQNGISIRDLKIKIFNEFNGLFKNNIGCSNPLYSLNFDRCRLQDQQKNDLSETHTVYELLKDMDAIYIVTTNTSISSASIEQINQHKQKLLQQQNQQQQVLLQQQQRQKSLQQQQQQIADQQLEQQLDPQLEQQLDQQLDPQVENFLEDDAFKIDPLPTSSSTTITITNVDNNNDQCILDNKQQHIYENEIDDRLTKKIKSENVSLSESSSVVSSPITPPYYSPKATTPQQPTTTTSVNHYTTNNPLLPEQHLLPTISSLPMQIKPPSLQHIQQLQNLHSLTPFNSTPSILSLISPTTSLSMNNTSNDNSSLSSSSSSSPVITSIGTTKKSKKSLSSSTSSTSGSSPSTPTSSSTTPNTNRCTPYCPITTEKNHECSLCQQIRPYSIVHTDGSDSNTCTKWCISSKQRKQKSIGLDFCSICLSRSRTFKYNPQNHQCQECQRPWMMLTGSSNLCKRCFKKGQQSK